MPGVSRGTHAVEIAIASATCATIASFLVVRRNVWNDLRDLLLALRPLKSEPVSPIKRGRRDIINEDLYRRSKVPSNIDVIVVGSGIAGLITAGLLAKIGKKVLVLEQHYRSGGCTHMFHEHGDNLFDSGIHYLGNPFGWHDFVMPMFVANGGAAVKFQPLGSEEDGYLYDNFDFGDGDMVSYRKGTAALEEELVRKFPEDAQLIRTYLHRTLTCATWSMGYSLLPAKLLPRSLLPVLGPAFLLGWRHYAAYTPDDFLTKYGFKSSKLRALLAGGQLIDWNGLPKETSFWVSAGIMTYYANGAFYPENGPEKIAEHFIPLIESAGGRVLTRALVKEIIVENDRAVGVKLKNEDEIRSPLVVSDANPLITQQLLGKKGMTPPTTAKPGKSAIYGFISLDGPPESFDLKSPNYHTFPGAASLDYDITVLQHRLYQNPDEFAKHALVWLTVPCMKDKTYAERYPGKSNLLLLAEAQWEWFKDFDSTRPSPSSEREPGYLRIKQLWKDVFLERVYKYFPKTRGHVSHIEIGTPFSAEKFLNAPNGCSYGLDWTPERCCSMEMFKFLHPQTPVRSLYQTGGDTFIGSYFGSAIAGFVTTFHVLHVPQHIYVTLPAALLGAAAAFWTPGLSHTLCGK